ncbi:hypothetical protein BDV23DRAFT_130706 [Aspergillus alliaceus]|uniref:Uncharacterized protein n=1 Tax=Petromyces alliaceus TaxID=209559 RepID=A0A5N7C038_PETAA|nr:hypothetical protein BDV23DRAFT_130706 [Aspergillus alliaceus]
MSGIFGLRLSPPGQFILMMVGLQALPWLRCWRCLPMIISSRTPGREENQIMTNSKLNQASNAALLPIKRSAHSIPFPTKSRQCQSP